MFPRIFGHEAAGIVESVGEGVTDLKPGDHVLPVFTGECKNCAHCRSTKSNLCAQNRIDVTRGVMLLDQTTRFHPVDGKPIYNFMGSTFSEYTVMEHQNVVKVGDDAPLDKICVLSCGVTTGFGSSWKYAEVEKGSCVAVFGLGTIGLAVAGATRIIGVGSFYQNTDSGCECGVPSQIMFNMPLKNKEKFWYSLDYGLFHFCFIDSEHDWHEGTEQYKFIEECLASADRLKQPWLIFAAHRVLGYSSYSSFVLEQILCCMML